MPTFDTPGPIRARIEVAYGAVQVRADDRHDTTVTVRPRNADSAADVTAAEQTQVTLRDGELLVRSTSRPRLLFFGSGPEIEVDVVLPAGSALDVRTTAGDITCLGRLGAADLECKHGAVRVDRAGTLRARSASGNVSADTVDGRTEVTTSYGEVRIGETAGPARLETGYGNVTVDRALGSVTGTTKYGQVRVGEAVRGSLVLETAYGEVEAGVREGTAAWLDVSAGTGRVRNLLTESAGPEGADETVEIHARTSYGDITVRRA
ncbi:Putative adhesin [Blastococcus fimeti]|nr:Putative adhesin [Blastococcus fimeti]